MNTLDIIVYAIVFLIFLVIAIGFVAMFFFIYFRLKEIWIKKHIPDKFKKEVENVAQTEERRTDDGGNEDRETREGDRELENGTDIDEREGVSLSSSEDLKFN